MHRNGFGPAADRTYICNIKSSPNIYVLCDKNLIFVPCMRFATCDMI